MKKALIAYMSKTNTTKETAERLAIDIENNGFTVDLKLIPDVDDVVAYDIILIGTPINGMRMLEEAHIFVNKYASTLVQKKVAYFAVSYIYFTGNSKWKKTISKCFDPLKQTVMPITTAIFGGKIDKKMPTVARLLFGIKTSAPIDVTDQTDTDTFIKAVLAE